MQAGRMNLFRSLRRFGVAATFAAVAVAVKKGTLPAGPNDSTKQKHQKERINFPGADFPPFRNWNYNWDGMHPGQGGSIWPLQSSADSCGSEKEKVGACKCKNCTKNANADANSEPSVARRHIFLIRHGQYNSHRGDGDKCHTLTALGEEQAAFVGKKMGSLGIKFTSITSSNMTRAKQTAQIMLENMKEQCLKLEVNDPLLNEGAPCIPEPPYSRPEVWNPDQRDILVDGARIEAGFRKYFHRADPSQKEDSWEIIVCHGNVIRYCTCRALQFPPEGWLRISIDHCSITKFTILPSGEVFLRGLGDSGHIPNEKVTAA